MNRRNFFRLLLTAPAATFLGDKSELRFAGPGLTNKRVERPRIPYPVEYPAHECVDRSTLSCPACAKWTGDPFASVKSNPKCFPVIAETA
jgi:hypothetical protein